MMMMSRMWKSFEVSRAECEQQSCIVSVVFQSHLSATVSDRGTSKSCYCCGCQTEIQHSTPIPLSDIYLFFQLLDLNPNKHHDNSSTYFSGRTWLKPVCVCQQFISTINLTWYPCKIISKTFVYSLPILFKPFCGKNSMSASVGGLKVPERWVMNNDTQSAQWGQWVLFFHPFTCCFPGTCHC